MILQNEEAVKKELSLREPRGVYLLFGDEPALLSLYRKKLISRLCNDGADPDRFDGKRLDLPALADAVSLLSMFGGRRVTEVADLAPEQLSEPDCKALCALLGEIPPDSTLLLVCEADSLDLKKGKNAKRLHAAADAAGAVLTLNRRTSAELRATLRNRCQKKGCELSSDEANLLIERCGDDLSALLNECDKLCAYAQGRPITAAMIRTLCMGTISADLYAVAKLMLRRRPQPVLDEIDALLRSRQPAALILANLGGAFSDLARGCAARSAGKNGADLAADFSYRFAWKAANALRDSNGLDAKRVQRVCEILCEAETTLKSASCDERVLLETAVVRSMLALRGGAMLKVRRPIVVEGRYDRIRLSSVIDGVILETGGFRIFKDKEMLEALRHLARTTGLILLTDSDQAGFRIRNFLRSALGRDARLTQVYIPGIRGVERRKAAPSAEGLLGVEGMEESVLLEAFRRAGIGCEEVQKSSGLTRADLFDARLTGAPDSAERRRMLLQSLSLPQRLSTSAMLDLLGTLLTREEFLQRTASLDQLREESSCS